MPNATESSVNAIKHAAADRINWANGFVDSILGAMTDDQLMARAANRGNHAIWIMGHIAQSTDAILAGFAQPRKLEHFDELFAGGTTPTDDRAAYPSREDLRAAMDDARNRLLAWVESLDESTLHTPAPEPLQPFAPDAITTAFTIAAHDLFHLGQIASIRASLNLEPVHR